MLLMRFRVPKRPLAVSQPPGSWVVDKVPRRHHDSHQNHRVLDGLQQNASQACPGGHIRPIKPQVGKDGQDDCGGQIGPENGVFDAYFPVDFHLQHSLFLRQSANLCHDSSDKAVSAQLVIACIHVLDAVQRVFL